MGYDRPDNKTAFASDKINSQKMENISKKSI